VGQDCSSSLLLDRKSTLTQLGCQKSSLSYSSLFIAAVSPVQPLLFWHCHRGTSYSMCCFFHVWWRVIVSGTNNAYAHTHKDVYTPRLSLQLMFREAATQANSTGCCFEYKKLLWLTLSEFKLPSRRHELCCWFRRAQQVLFQKVSPFLFSFDQTIRKTPGQTSICCLLS